MPDMYRKVLILLCVNSVFGLSYLVNPRTNRRIRLGGPTYRVLLAENEYVYHQGRLWPFNWGELQNTGGANLYGGPILNGDTDSVDLEIGGAEPSWYALTPYLAKSPSAPATKLGCNLEHELISQDLLFVHKDSGIPSVPTRQNDVISLSTAVASSRPGAKLCHRLDRDTSGILVFGLNAAAHADISQQFATRSVSKVYTALVAGELPETSGTVDLPIGKELTSEGFHRWAVNGAIKPRPALTNYSVIESFEREGRIISRVELVPLTGRGHQLRLHLKDLGCPILGDTLHGDPSAAYCVPRLCLHATKLQVNWEDVRVEVESLPPF